MTRWRKVKRAVENIAAVISMAAMAGCACPTGQYLDQGRCVGSPVPTTQADAGAASPLRRRGSASAAVPPLRHLWSHIATTSGADHHGYGPSRVLFEPRSNLIIALNELAFGGTSNLAKTFHLSAFRADGALLWSREAARQVMNDDRIAGGKLNAADILEVAEFSVSREAVAVVGEVSGKGDLFGCRKSDPARKYYSAVLSLEDGRCRGLRLTSPRPRSQLRAGAVGSKASTPTDADANRFQCRNDGSSLTILKTNRLGSRVWSVTLPKPQCQISQGCQATFGDCAITVDAEGGLVVTGTVGAESMGGMFGLPAGCFGRVLVSLGGRPVTLEDCGWFVAKYKQAK